VAQRNEYRVSGQKLSKRDHLEDLVAHRMTILKWIFKTPNEIACTGIATSSRLL
jgi:hypothetical protein